MTINNTLMKPEVFNAAEPFINRSYQKLKMFTERHIDKIPQVQQF